MNDRTAYWLDRPSTSPGKRAAHKLVAVIFMVLTLVVVAVGLSGTTAQPGQASTPLAVTPDAPALADPAPFTTRLERIMLADARLGQAAFYARQYPHSLVWQQNYEGMVRSCQRAVAEYDAAAAKYTQRALSNEGLPRRIDITAATTDCRAPLP